MKILISKNPSKLCVTKNGLTDFEKQHIETGEFPGIEIKEKETHYELTGRKDKLYDFLYDTTKYYDIDLC